MATGLTAGLLILKHMHNVSDEALCDRWVENLYFQYFWGEVVLQHELQDVTKASRREMRRRAAAESVIGHLKDDHRMRGNYLKGRDGDRINTVLAAAGYKLQPAPALVRGALVRLQRALSMPRFA